jgi:histidinol phosphatase-like enzyme
VAGQLEQEVAMLYCFDIDGTLIKSFMRDGPEKCPSCGCPRYVQHWDNCPIRTSGVEEFYGVDDYARIEVLPGRIEKITVLAAQPRARFALVTNQGGVAFGYQTVEQAWRKVGGVVAAFSGFLTRPVTLHVAMGHPKATIDPYRHVHELTPDYRKPGGGMIIEAIERHRADTSSAVFVGDMDSDELAALAAGVPYYDAEEFFNGDQGEAGNLAE